MQLAVGQDLAVIDTIEVQDLTPLWRRLAEGPCETIVHSGREEILFCIHAVGKPPAKVFDTQIAAGLAGFEYPAGYGALVQKLTGETPPKGETRTDWRRRPLAQRQIEYALIDVVHLQPMRDKLMARIKKLGRAEWLAIEHDRWIDELQQSLNRERWRRVSGLSGLGAKSMAVARELWRWREEEAERRDMPPRRVLRDDLIVELAKRRSDDPKRIAAVRGMERGDLKRAAPKLAQAIRKGLDTPDEELPRGRHRQQLPTHFNMLGQFLYSAVSSICRKMDLAPSLVCNPNDVRELVAYRLGYLSDGNEPPVLASGWRAEVVGKLIDDLLAGKLAMRITDPTSDEPLTLERLE